LLLDSVREVRLTPNKTQIHVGEELRCSAHGNPSPRLTFTPAAGAQQTEGRDGGEAWKKMVVPADWRGKRRTVTCKAVNTLDDGVYEMTANVTFTVLGQ